MKRWAFNHLRWITNAFCLFSLLVFLSSVTLWVRSYFVGDSLAHWRGTLDAEGRVVSRGAISYEIMTARGALGTARTEYDFDGRRAPPLGWRYKVVPSDVLSKNALNPLTSVDLQFAGFAKRHATFPFGNGTVRLEWVTVPLWLFLPAAVPPFLWWRKWRKKGGRGFAVEMIPAREHDAEAGKVQS